MNILQSIFTDYYEHIIYQLHTRPAVIENVTKMIHCGESSIFFLKGAKTKGIEGFALAGKTFLLNRVGGK